MEKPTQEGPEQALSQHESNEEIAKWSGQQLPKFLTQALESVRCQGGAEEEEQERRKRRRMQRLWWWERRTRREVCKGGIQKAPPAP